MTTKEWEHANPKGKRLGALSFGITGTSSTSSTSSMFLFFF